MSKMIVLLVAVLVTACQAVSRFRYVSPDRSSEVIVEPAGIKGYHVVLKEKGREFELYDTRSSTPVYFADVVWSPDGRTVAIATCGGPNLRIAVDRTTLEARSFALVSATFLQRWRREYNLMPGESMCELASSAAFGAKFGHVP